MPNYANMDTREKEAFEQNAKAYAAGTDPATTIQAASTTALSVANTNPNYAFQVDTSIASQVTGIKVVGNIAGSGVAVSVIGGNSAETLSLDAEGTGTINIAGTSTGVVNVGRGAVLLSTATIASATNIVAGGLNVSAGGATITGQQTVFGPTTASSLVVSATAPVAGATLAAINIVASTPSQAVLSISGVFMSTASINVAANKTAFIIPVYHETQRVWGYLAASVGVS